MSPRSRFAVLALAALCVAAPPAEAAKHHKKRSACQRLKAKHDLAPAKKVKLVSRHGELRGCVLPRGKVRHIAFCAHTDTSSDDYSVRRGRGALVLPAWSLSS